MRVAGASTYFLELGDSTATPLILIHGFRGDHHGLELIANNLDNVRVIVPDLPGFGLSEALKTPHTLEHLSAWLTEFCRAVLPGEEFHLLGHSFGSIVVTHAVANGLTPRSLTLVNPISAPALAGPKKILSLAALFYYRLAAVLPPRLGEGLLRNRLIVRLMSEVMAKSRDRKVRSWIHDQHRQFFSVFSDTKSLLQSFETSIAHTVGEYAPHVPVQTLVIAGALDDITPLRDQLAVTQAFPNANLKVIGDSGHLIHYEAPKLCADYVSLHVERES